MDTAELVAQKLALRFYNEGSYVLSPAHKGQAISQVMPAAAAGGPDVSSLFDDDASFAGLAVQAVGYEKGGEEPVVHVYVSKGSRKAIEKAIPAEKGEVKIIVNRIGKLVVRPEQANTATHRGNLYVHNDRIACGSSCAPSGEEYSGTFGALIRKRGIRNELFMLSCNHVLAACNHVPVGMPIMAPSNKDGSPTIRPPSAIARHQEICELRSGEPALVQPGKEDVALARILDRKVVTSWQGDDASGYDTPSAIVAPTANLTVKKFGRTTGRTDGRIESCINTPTPILYKTRHFFAKVYLQDVWTVAGKRGMPFALPGDSGSLVVTDDAKHAVGIVFAVQKGEYAFMVPMEHVASCFGGITLVANHGV